MADKNTSSSNRLNNNTTVNIYAKNMPVQFGTADTCIVYEGGNPYYMIYPWVQGDELFKAYQNPAATCDNPYPFTIDRVHVVFYLTQAASFVLSADIELLDLSDPACPKPGTMIALTEAYEYQVTEANLYSITVPLDSPVVVDGPYFVGLYVAENGNPTSIAVVTDSVAVGCVSYNDWGYGYVDLDTVYTDPDGTGLIKTFPGRLVLYSSGTVGGSGATEPEPAAEFIYPAANQFIGESVDLWVNDAAGSAIIEQADFYYNNTGSWNFIGNDTSDDPPLRNGSTGSGSGNGLSYRWFTSGLAEGSYQLRSIITDTLGRTDTAEISVSVDPTPHFPEFAVPRLGLDICDGIQASIDISDENISYMTFETKSINTVETITIPIINQTLGGDTNGNPIDGNPSLSGEYGPFCSGPASAAMAIKYWSQNGHATIIQEGVASLTDAQLIDRFFDGMKISEYLGAYDEEFITGLRQYILSHGGGFNVSAKRDPVIDDLYNLPFNSEEVIMAGLSGDPGRWMVLAGVNGLHPADSQHVFKFADPATGTTADYAVKTEFGKLWVEYFSQWYEIDIIAGLIPSGHTVARTSIGFDGNGTDGWGLFWNSSSLPDNQHHFLHVTAFDGDSHSGSASVLVKTECSTNILPGDVNNDGSVNPGDLIYLMNYLFLNDLPPPAGFASANVNGDNLIDLADVMYLYRYLFLGGQAPI
ncbi:MAG: dockerin type I repeat-containing protein [candidate division Zixibacteria bacterium]|nr:dockerin type I repeat-containing protein [candidate division Zixibacteria bacterium]